MKKIGMFMIIAVIVSLVSANVIPLPLVEVDDVMRAIDMIKRDQDFDNSLGYSEENDLTLEEKASRIGRKYVLN